MVVSSTIEHEIIQARGRIRHNIACLWYLTNDSYECETGVKAHRNLVTRLEHLAETSEPFLEVTSGCLSEKLYMCFCVWGDM